MTTTTTRTSTEMAETRIDLRSDTVTQPDAAMRQAMADAVVGDDVYGEDPTVRQLEEEAAACIGHEAALFVPTGTMGNQIALHLHGRPGTEVICGNDSHVYLYEMAAMSALSGLLPKTVATVAGRLLPEMVAPMIPPPLPYRAPASVLVIENSANMAGGCTYSRAQLDPLLALARQHRLATHLDGARIFNAAVAQGVAASELAAGFDSVMFCLSKGLGAPVGSLICGSRAFVQEAWRVRKMFGGGMRQVGVLAAAGLLALRDGPARLADDHANAQFLAAELAAMPGIDLDPSTVETNIVIFGLRPERPTANQFCAELARHGVLCGPVASDRVRMVTHRDVDRTAITRALEVIAETQAA
jgi:threonine aldolase